MFKSCSYTHKQTCLKFFQTSLSGYSKKHLEISKENLFSVSLQKISTILMERNSSMIPSPVEFPMSERGREGWGWVVWIWIFSWSTHCCLFV